MKRLLTLTLLAYLCATQAVWGAVACGTATTGSGTTDPLTLTYTPDAGANRIVLFFGGIREDGNSIVGASSSAGGTWTVLTSGNICSSTTGQTICGAIFYSTDFTDGSQTLSLDIASASLQGAVGAMTCTGVNTASPWRGAATTANVATTSPSTINVPSAVGELVVDLLVQSASALTVDGSQTQKFNLNIGGGNLMFGGSTEAGAAGNVAMTWTWASGSHKRAHIGGSLVPASTAVKHESSLK